MVRVGVVVHIELVAATASHVDAMRFQNLLVLAFIQTLAIHKEIGALQRQGSIARHADGVPVVIGRAGPRHVNIHILEGEIGTPERDASDLGLAFSFATNFSLGLTVVFPVPLRLPL